MSYGLADDVVIVTGAALGIGKGIAQAFLDEDARVILVDIIILIS